MARGGFRVGAGRPKGSKGGQRQPPKVDGIPVEVIVSAKIEGVTPLEYMLKVMNNPEADQARRDRMAMAAAPFVHPRVADNRFGKKDGDAAAAEEAAAGKFAPPKAPKLVVNND